VVVTVGEFARLGGTSVRALHHYDAIGRLSPASVDPATSYRRYELEQLSRLNRILALKDLGFSPTEVANLVEETVDVAELRGMLRLRRAELQAGIDEDRARLEKVEARLRTIELEGSGPGKVTVQRLFPMRVASMTAAAAELDPAAVAPVLRPLFAEVFRRLSASDVRVTGAPLARYEQVSDADHVLVHACVPVPDSSDGTDCGLEVVDLDDVSSAATMIHQGLVGELASSWQHLAKWVDDHGHVSVGEPRETYLDTAGATDSWRIELAQPVTAATARSGRKMT